MGVDETGETEEAPLASKISRPSLAGVSRWTVRKRPSFTPRSIGST
jgi:hypothetical protein